MDLRIEKAEVRRGLEREPGERLHATCLGIAHVAELADLLPIGMVIGPFSLMSKILADPITPLALAGIGMSAEQEPEVAGLERCLEMAELAVLRSLRARARITSHSGRAIVGTGKARRPRSRSSVEEEQRSQCR